MRKSGAKWFWLGLLLSLVALLAWKYSQMDDGQKRYVKNLLRQIPDMPGRYAV